MPALQFLGIQCRDRYTTREKGRLPLPFLIFEKKDHFCVKFSIQNVVLRVYRRKNSKILPCGAFLSVFLTKCLLKCPNSLKPPCPEKFLVAHLREKNIVVLITTMLIKEQMKCKRFTVNCGNCSSKISGLTFYTIYLIFIFIFISSIIGTLLI